MRYAYKRGEWIYCFKGRFGSRWVLQSDLSNHVRTVCLPGSNGVYHGIASKRRLKRTWRFGEPLLRTADGNRSHCRVLGAQVVDTATLLGEIHKEHNVSASRTGEET